MEFFLPRFASFFALLSFFSVAYAQEFPSLAHGVNVSAAQQCISAVNQATQPLTTYEQKNMATLQIFNEQPDSCGQTALIYQKEGLIPFRIQAVGPVTVFTFFHPGDGQESFHMIDQAGTIIDLVDDQDATIAQNKEFQKIQKMHPGAGLMMNFSGKAAELPQVVMPTALANKKGNANVMQLVFPQLLKEPPCQACATVAVADIAYQFSYPEGNYLGPVWLKTDAFNQASDVVDED